MKIQQLLRLAAVFVTVSVPAISGHAFEGAVGNGGTAVVCRDRAGKIESAELLDLYEARVFRGVEIYRAGAGQKADYLKRAVARLSFSELLQADTWNYVTEIEGRSRDVKSRYLYKPEAIREVLPKLAQPGCGFEVVINYLADYDVRVNRAVLDALPAVDQAALGVHEALFRMARERAHVRNSLLVRPIVAALFATHAEASELAKLAAKPLAEVVQNVSLYAGAGAAMRIYFDVGFGIGGPDHFQASSAECKIFVYEPASEKRQELGKWFFGTWMSFPPALWNFTVAKDTASALDGKTLALECKVSGEVHADLDFRQNGRRVPGGHFRRAVNPWNFGEVQNTKYRITVLPGEPPKGRAGN